MNTENQITATRALTELKLINKRILKKVQNSCFVTSKIGSEIEDKDCDAAKDLQSITDLITRYDAIKAALVLSNSITKIKILDQEMTVAEAIDKKSSISYFEALLHTLRDQRLRTIREMDNDNIEAQMRLDRLLESTFGKDLKARASEITDLSDTFWKANKTELHDTIQITKKINELDEYIDNFNSEVDLTLSEINATTLITIR